MPPDYSCQNLQGRSFEGQNLEGANFSKADIRGADFTNAFLRGANFSGATAGLQRRWVIILLIIALLLLALAGIYSIIIGSLVANIFDTKHPGNTFIGAVSLFFVAVFCIGTIRKDLTTGLKALAIAFFLTFPGVFVVAVTFPGAFAVTRTFPRGFARAFAFAFAIVFILFNVYIDWRNQGREEKDAWLHSLANIVAAIGGTSFRGADLTDADFTGAILKNTDFRTANLTRTRFYEAKKLDFARPGNTILNNPAVLNLLVTLNGRNKSYFGANLKGANLIGADLKEANLKNTNISEATFEGANLEWANLTLSQAIGTNFTNAQMTGACVEAWNIQSTTILDHVDCRFVYLLEYAKPGTNERERCPSSGEFQPGEFTKLFVTTVDLIFRNGINWQAFVGAFKGIQVQNENTELNIQSIENKGDGSINIQINVPLDTDKEKIHIDFTQNYQLALAAVEEKYKAQLQAKNDEIVFERQQSAEMTEIVKLLANKPINVQIDNKVENENMTNDSSRKVEIGSFDGEFNASRDGLNVSEISGEELRKANSNLLNDTKLLVDNLNLENYVDLTIVAGLQNLSQLYRKYLLEEDYMKVVETADSAYQMCQTIAESLDKEREREKDIYIRVTSLASYWKLNKDLYRGLI